MVSLTPIGRRTAVMVASAGVRQALMDEILMPQGFAPVITTSSISELTSVMRQRQASLVVLPVDQAGIDPEFVNFEIELRRLGVAAIGTAPTKDADVVLAAMRTGVSEFVLSPPGLDELRTAVSRVLARNATATARGKVYTVYTGKGGLGASTIAASLSWELAHRADKARVALADFTTAGAGVRVMLNLAPAYDLGNIASRAEHIDRELIRSVMVKHPETVSILAAAEEVDGTDPLGISAATRLFEIMRQEYAHIVVDADHHFAEPTIAALDVADRIVLITQLDVSALRSTQRTLGLFYRLGYGYEKVLIVVNRRSDRDRISVSDAEKVLGRPIDFSVPNDYASCSDAITHGQFVQKHAPGSPLGAALRPLASQLTGADPRESQADSMASGKSRIARFFGMR